MDLPENAYSSGLGLYTSFRNAFKKIHDERQETYLLLKRTVIDSMPNSKAKGTLLEAMKKAIEEGPNTVYKAIDSSEFQDELASYPPKIQEDLKMNIQIFMIQHNSIKEVKDLTDRVEKSEIRLIEKEREIHDLTSKLDYANSQIESYNQTIQSKDRTIYELNERIVQLEGEIDQHSLPFDAATRGISEILSRYTESQRENEELRRMLEEKNILLEDAQKKLVDSGQVVQGLHDLAKQDRRKRFPQQIENDRRRYHSNS